MTTKTVFCSTTVTIAGVELFIDGNSKITASGGDFEHPIPNAFSLPAIATCPGSTAACRSACYVAGLRKHAPDLAAAYERNEAALHWILDNAFAISAAEFGEWIGGNCQELRGRLVGSVRGF